MSFKNLQGQKFGSLTVIKQVARERGSKDKKQDGCVNVTVVMIRFLGLAL